MRKGSSHGAFTRLTKPVRPRPRLSVRFQHATLNPVTRESFKDLQVDLDEEPYIPPAESNPHAKDIAVLGGGITGLATAFELSRSLPNAKITIYEAGAKLGGWMDSDIIPVGDGEVVFEWGPRTLRHTADGSGAATINMMARLGMGPDIVSTSTRSPAARNRYIYYPDHLVRMPGPIPGAGMLTNIFSNFSTILTEPVFKGAFSGVLAEPAVDPRGTNVEDESVGDFITRRMGRPIAENLVSAFLHGIYAGDLYKLSARTLFPYLWHLETMDTGIVGSLFENAWNSTSVFSYRQLEFLSRLSDAMPPAAELEEVLRPLSRASVYTFRRGLNQLVTSLESALRKSSNVTIRTSTIAHSLCLEGDDPENKTIEIRTPQSNGEDDVYKHDYLVSTVSPTALAKTLPDKKSGKKLNTHSALSTALGPMPGFVNVMVVNLFYSNPNLLPIRGFGYLLPRSVPLEQNPERALGVIFGTETSTGTAMLGIPADGPMDRDTLVKNAAMADSLRVKQDTVPGTKLTVMLGGHWWDGWDADKDLPDEETAISMARAVLERHLAIVEEPVVAKARLARNAIPQYRVGYQQDMQRVHESLIGEFGGRLKIAGSWCQGAVGVNDCVKTATEVAWSIRDGANNKTGAERFGKEERYVMIEKDGRVVRESLKGRQE